MSHSLNDISTPPCEPLPDLGILYQSERLRTYTDRLIHGFSGKPLSLGGLAQALEQTQQNRQQFCKQLGLNADNLIVPSQVHSANLKTNRDPDFSETDGIILLDPGIPALLVFADCVPVILYDPVQHIGAVIHAGWRGTAQAISAQAAQMLIEAYGSQPENIIAAIGPSIGQCCYEVSPEVEQQLAFTVSDPVFSKINSAGKPQVDLKQVNQLQLQALGIQQIDVLNVCTHCQPELLWSHRRGEAGRQCAFLQLNLI